MDMEGIDSLRKNMNGLEIASFCLEDMRRRSAAILKELGLENRLCLITFGSASGRFLTPSSDTDFSVLRDGTVTAEELSALQRALFTEFEGKPWIVTFKTWDRLSVNPMDLLSVCYLCGDYSLFEEKILRSPAVSEVLNRESLVTLLAGNYLHLKFMSSPQFSSLLSRYHSSHEMPVPIGRGDVKYYLGGVRSVQYILMTLMLFQGETFLTDLSVAAEDCRDLFSEEEIKSVTEAADFLLTVKGLCTEGNNIFYAPNMEKIRSVLPYTEEEIASRYQACADRVTELCRKADGLIRAGLDEYEGVRIVTTEDTAELEALIDAGSPNVWRTLALRDDLPPGITGRLLEAVDRRQRTAPHTMLDEIKVMLQYNGVLREDVREDTGAHVWLTDEVTGCFDAVLGNTTDSEPLIRKAVHSSFFRLFSEGKNPDIHDFTKEYLDRVTKYFHCHTLFPSRETSFATAVCQHILHSGLFDDSKLILSELHLTNECNLGCEWCTYSSRDRKQSLQLSDIGELAALNPNEVLIAGGGEPTLFRCEDGRFNEAVHFLREKLPGARLRLITNGTWIPEGGWTDEIDEVSISLDEGDREAYRANKHADLFDRVWSNIRKYLYDTRVAVLRVSKVYDSQSHRDSDALAEKLYELWKLLPENSVKKRYFSFMLFAMADDTKQGASYNVSRLAERDKADWRERLSSIQKEKPGFCDFLEKHTNLTTFFDNEPSETVSDRCWNSAGYMLLGADGVMYPCFASCSSFRTVNFGSIRHGTKALAEIRSELFSRPPLSCRAGCRPGNVFYGALCRESRTKQERMGLPMTAIKPKRKTIVHVSYHDPAHLNGGQGWAVYELCREQIEKDCQVYWISPCVKNEVPGEYLYENGRLRVIKLKFTEEYVETLFSDSYGNHETRMAFGRLIVPFIARHFSPEECSVHLHGFIEVPSHAAELISRGYKVISTFHMLLSDRRQHIIPSGEPLTYLPEAERHAIEGNRVITVPSEGMVEELEKKCPDHTGRILCVPNGIGREHFDTEYNPDGVSDHRIVSFGRISPEKGFELLIEAAQMYNRAALIPADLFIFGNTDFTIEARKQYAEKLRNMVSCDDHITLSATNTGIVGTGKIREIDKAYFGVIPSLYEPFGLVIPELMARRKPVIAAYTAGACDIMKTKARGRNDFGFIVDPEPEAIMRAIEWMFEHPDEVQSMSRNAYERSMDFMWTKIAEQFSGLY